jgi:hypothetical protein
MGGGGTQLTLIKDVQYPLVFASTEKVVGKNHVWAEVDA